MIAQHGHSIAEELVAGTQMDTVDDWHSSLLLCSTCLGRLQALTHGMLRTTPCERHTYKLSRRLMEATGERDPRCESPSKAMVLAPAQTLSIVEETGTTILFLAGHSSPITEIHASKLSSGSHHCNVAG